MPPFAKPKTNFRFDINALRAWAVLSVVLFHFSVPGFSGGFIGVDIFFVISGYLMTKIVMSEVINEEFSFVKFYSARMRRILPALLAMILALLLVGWWLLASIDYEQLGSHAGYAIIFWSNVRFWREAGYFDAASGEKWLLHTWSLSVEWQFYLILPIVIFLLWYFWPSIKAIFIAYLAVFIFSFGLSAWLALHQPDAAFYGLHSRAWEMLAGGIVYFLEGRFRCPELFKRWLARCSLGLILLAIFMLDDSVWPGLPALLPVAATALMLFARHESSWLNRAQPLQWLGTRSYSIYLWHWPIVVIMHYLELGTEGWFLTAGLLATLGLGALSYRFIELRSQRWLAPMSHASAIKMVFVLMLAIGAIAHGVKSMDGVPDRLPAAVLAIEHEAKNINPRREKCHGGGDKHPDCIFGGPTIGAIILGDSHASSVVTALQAALPSASDGVLALSYTSCPTIVGVQKRKIGHGCHAFNEWALQKLSQQPSNIPLVIINRSSAYLFESSELADPPLKQEIYFDTADPVSDAAFLAQVRDRMLNTYCALASERPTFLVEPLPEMPKSVPDAMARAMMQGRLTRVAISLKEHQRRHAFVLDVQREAVKQCGVVLLDPLPYLCRDGECQGDSGGRPRYSDDNHLNESGNQLLIPMFRTIFARRGLAGSERSQ